MDAEFEGANEVSTADLPDAETMETEVESTDTEVTTESDTETESAPVEEAPEAEAQVKQSAEDNAKYAAARRQAEEDFRRQKAQSDAEAKRLFGNYKHPDTGKPIESWEEYASAIEAQTRHQQEKQLEKAGLDPKLIDKMVENSPAMRQAKEVIQQNKLSQAKQTLDSDVKAISKIDPDIKSVDDLLKSDNYSTVYKYVSENKLSLVDAYKLANSDKLSAKESAAVKQAAINSAKSTTHLETTRGVKNTGKEYTPIPKSIVSHWQEAYPGLSLEKLTEKYNSVM